MPTELNRAKEIIQELEGDSKDLLAEYFSKRDFEEGVKYLQKRKWRDFKDILSKDDLAKVWAFGKAQEIFDDILKFYRERRDYEFKKVISSLYAKKNLTYIAKALFILLDDIHFFNRCYDMLSIYTHDDDVYESYEGKKDIEITEKNCLKFEKAISEYVYKEYKAGKHCQVEYDK